MHKMLLKIRKKLPVLAFDALAIPFAWFVAYGLRFGGWQIPAHFTAHWMESLGVLFVLQMACFYHFRVYRGVWHFCSLSDLSRILKAALAAPLLAVPLLYLCSFLEGLPRSILLLYSMVLILTLGGARLIARYHRDQLSAVRKKNADAERVIVIGAGHAGEGLVRELKRTARYVAVGIVDDNPRKKGLEVHGVRVLGSIKELPRLVQELNITLIFIAMPAAGSVAMRRVVGICEASRVPFRTLPGLRAIASGRVEINSLRNVNIEDLLGRDEVTLEWDRIGEAVSGKRILVTGGGGSIGSELCRQVLALNPAEIVVLDHAEYNLYRIEMELKGRFPAARIVPILASVTDKTLITEIFQSFRPQTVFHAAAYKHVPLLEHQVQVAIKNNITGTRIVAEASVQADVEKFVLISTDKAVNPTNVMGTTKRVAEIFCQNLNARVKTRFVTVRFGNVLGSAGSVVPLFKKQLRQGGPLTVTHPDMARYFMTIPEACQLILQAMVNGNGGEIFVLDMGEPVKISYLAEQIIRLAGKEPGRDIQIEYTGLRPGEKLFEELFHPSEKLQPTAHEKLFMGQFREIRWDNLQDTLHQIDNAANTHNVEAMLSLLQQLVPEYHRAADGKEARVKESVV